MILADSRPIAIRRSLLPVLSTYFYKNFTHPHKKGKCYPFESMIALLIVGLMCGHDGYTPIATWARYQTELTELLGFTPGKTPAVSTIHNLLKRLEPDFFQQIFTKLAIEIEKTMLIKHTVDLKQGVSEQAQV